MPTYIGSGALAQAASGNVSPAVHASTIAGDTLVCVVYSGDNVAHSVAGYTQVPSANVTAGTTSRLSVWTKTAVGGDTAPTVTHTGGDQIEARVHTLRSGAGTGTFSSNTGTPAAGVAVSSTTSTDMTPQNSGSLILSIIGLSNNDTSTPFNFNPTGGTNPTFTERTDDAGNGLGSRQTGMMMDTGTPSVTSAIGARTTNMTATVTPNPGTGSITWVNFMLEILPAPVASGFVVSPPPIALMKFYPYIFGFAFPVPLLTPAIGAGFNITLGLVSETDSLFALSRLKTKALGLVTESDLLFALSRLKAKTLGLVTETDSAFVLTKGKAKTLGLPSELDTALALTRSKAKALGVITESDLVFAVGKLKSKGLNQVIEVDSVFSIAKSKARLLGLPTETDIALAIVHPRGAISIQIIRPIIIGRF